MKSTKILFVVWLGALKLQTSRFVTFIKFLVRDHVIPLIINDYQLLINQNDSIEIIYNILLSYEVYLIKICHLLAFQWAQDIKKHVMNVHLKERPYKCRYGCEVGKLDR